MPRNPKGFTLLELIVVVLIVATLTGLAIPRYIRAREYAITKEVITNLKLIHLAETIYYSEYRAYWPATLTYEDNIGVINSTLKLYLNETYWDYAVGNLDRYGAVPVTWANRVGTGPYQYCEYYLYLNTTGTEPARLNPSSCP